MLKNRKKDDKAQLEVVLVDQKLWIFWRHWMRLDFLRLILLIIGKLQRYCSCFLMFIIILRVFMLIICILWARFPMIFYLKSICLHHLDPLSKLNFQLYSNYWKFPHIFSTNSHFIFYWDQVAALNFIFIYLYQLISTTFTLISF